MKAKRRKKIVNGVLALAMCICLGSCSDENGNLQEKNSQMPKGEVSYPIQTEEKLTYWMKLNGALGTTVQNFGETPFAKELYKRTGIEVEYKHAAQGQEGEVLNLLIAAGDLPDIVETNWLSRDPDDCIANGTILRLNELFSDYSPNLMTYLNENPEINKAIGTDTGNYYAYPFVRGGEKLLSTEGFMLRNDWLKELDLPVPETIEEWNAVLAAFKTKCNSPLAMGLNQLMYFAGAYNTAYDFYIDGEKVIFGATTDAFRQCLETLHKWYQEGYIDKNFAILDTKLMNANMLQGESGVAFGAGGGTMGVYLSSAKDEKFDLVAAPFPTKEKGTIPQFGNKQFPYSPVSGTAITAQCKNPELAARFLDYSYSEEGEMLNNFGIEHVSYEVIDGEPVYTDLITNNPDGMDMSSILAMYVRSSSAGPFVQDERYIEQYYSKQQQKEALTIWSNNTHEQHAMPQITLTQEEIREFNSIMSEVRTYRDEMVGAFIIGSKPLEEFSEYVETIESFNIAKATEIQQAAYQRFNAR